MGGRSWFSRWRAGWVAGCVCSLSLASQASAQYPALFPHHNAAGEVVMGGPDYQLAMPMPAQPQRIQDMPVANMIGDSLGTFGDVQFSLTNVVTDPTTMLTTTETVVGRYDLPLSGRIPKVAENNSPIPRDRVYFAYNHFHRAYEMTATTVSVNPLFDPLDPTTTPTVTTRQSDAAGQNRFTIGLEKMFFDGDMSLEVRVPLVTQETLSGITTSTAGTEPLLAAGEDPTGDVSILFKQVVIDWNNASSAGVITWGAGFSLPTAEGVQNTLLGTQFRVEDTAYHFLPYLAAVVSEPNGFFMQTFMQLDLCNDYNQVTGVGGQLGKYRPPHRAFIDLGLGYWLFHNTDRTFFQGIAPMVEAHWTAQFQDDESVAFAATSTAGTGTIRINGDEDRRDVLNLTAGCHVALTSWANLRAAGVVPLREDPNREFDAEFVLQLDLTR